MCLYSFVFFVFVCLCRSFRLSLILSVSVSMLGWRVPAEPLCQVLLNLHSLDWNSLRVCANQAASPLPPPPWFTPHRTAWGRQCYWETAGQTDRLTGMQINRQTKTVPLLLPFPWFVEWCHPWVICWQRGRQTDKQTKTRQTTEIHDCSYCMAHRVVQYHRVVNRRTRTKTRTGK